MTEKNASILHISSSIFLEGCRTHVAVVHKDVRSNEHIAADDVCDAV